MQVNSGIFRLLPLLILIMVACDLMESRRVARAELLGEYSYQCENCRESSKVESLVLNDDGTYVLTLMAVSAAVSRTEGKWMLLDDGEQEVVLDHAGHHFGMVEGKLYLSINYDRGERYVKVK